MKRIIAFLTALCMLSAVPVISALAKNSTVSISEAYVNAGDEFEVKVDISECSFANLSLEISYDSDALTLLSVTNNASVGATYVGSQYITVNPYVLTWNSIDNVTFSGTLATLKFKISESADAGAYPVTVSYYKGASGKYTDNNDVNYDENFDGLELTYKSGAAIVYDMPPTATPTMKPTATPTAPSTATPTMKPTAIPTATPTATPTMKPTATPAETPSKYPYEIQNVTLKSESGDVLTEIPQDRGFIIDAEILKKNERNESGCIFAAIYGTDGTLLSFDYKQAQLERDTDIEFHVHNQNEEIGSIKVYVWHDFNSIEPLAERYVIKR